MFEKEIEFPNVTLKGDSGPGIEVSQPISPLLGSDLIALCKPIQRIYIYQITEYLNTKATYLFPSFQGICTRIPYLLTGRLLLFLLDLQDIEIVPKALRYL